MRRWCWPRNDDGPFSPLDARLTALWLLVGLALVVVVRVWVPYDEVFRDGAVVLAGSLLTLGGHLVVLMGIFVGTSASPRSGRMPSPPGSSSGLS